MTKALPRASLEHQQAPMVDNDWVSLSCLYSPSNEAPRALSSPDVRPSWVGVRRPYATAGSWSHSVMNGVDVDPACREYGQDRGGHGRRYTRIGCGARACKYATGGGRRRPISPIQGEGGSKTLHSTFLSKLSLQHEWRHFVMANNKTLPSNPRQAEQRGGESKDEGLFNHFV